MYAEDIQTLKPEWSLEECQTFLIEVGWEVLDALVSWE